MLLLQGSGPEASAHGRSEKLSRYGLLLIASDLPQQIRDRQSLPDTLPVPLSAVILPASIFVDQVLPHPDMAALQLITPAGNKNGFKALIAAELNGISITVPEYQWGVTNKSEEFLKLTPVGKV